MPPWSLAPDGIVLALRITPRAGRSAVDGVAADADGRPFLRIRLAAPPVEGAANRALVAFLAEALQLAPRAVTIRAGEAARLKRVHLAGDPVVLADRLAALISPLPPAGHSRPPQRPS